MSADHHKHMEMMKTRLAQEQPIAYQTLSHALRTHKLAHAYLFHGQRGCGKLAAARLLAQSMLCEHREESGFACEQCSACQRIAKGGFADLRILDGREVSIKKEDILKLRQEFQKTGLEHTGKRIYIINLAENATPEALNALLKFLEEPGDDVVAIIIVEQLDRLLPTIISRCQPILFQPLCHTVCYELAKKELRDLDAYLLSSMIRSVSDMKTASESEEYQHAFYLFLHMQEELRKSPYAALAFLLKSGVDGKKRDAKECMRYLLDMQMILCKDLIRGGSICQDVQYRAMLQAYKNKSYPYSEWLSILLETKDKLWKSVNVTLLCDQLMYRLKEAGK